MQAPHVPPSSQPMQRRRSLKLSREAYTPALQMPALAATRLLHWTTNSPGIVDLLTMEIPPQGFKTSLVQRLYESSNPAYLVDWKQKCDTDFTLVHAGRVWRTAKTALKTGRARRMQSSSCLYRPRFHASWASQERSLQTRQHQHLRARLLQTRLQLQPPQTLSHSAPRLISE